MSIKTDLYDLTFDSKPIPIRKDGFINVTIICKMVKKQFHDWYRLESSSKNIKETKKKLITENKIKPESEILYIGKNRHCHTWAHPYLATIIATWADYRIGIEVIDRSISGDSTLTDTITKHSTDTKPKKSLSGWLYFIQFKESIASNTICIKVGKTNKLQQRLKTHTRNSFHGLNVFFCCLVCEVDKYEKELIKYCDRLGDCVSSERFLIQEEQIINIIDKMKTWCN